MMFLSRAFILSFVLALISTVHGLPPFHGIEHHAARESFPRDIEVKDHQDPARPKGYRGFGGIKGINNGGINLATNPWIPADRIPNSSRSPCPMLNTLANHGFL